MLKVYSVYDLKAQSYGPLVAYANDGDACRAVRIALRGKDTTLSQFPGDFNLVYMLDFDPGSGQFSAPDMRIVCNLSALVE